MSLLSLDAVHAAYGKSEVLHGVSLALAAGEVVALIGRNGAGKTTALRAMAGLMPVARGRLLLDGTDIAGLPASRISRLGVNYVPDTRRIFPNLSVAENLQIATFAHRPGTWTTERVFGLFPRLHERRRSPGDVLSGGEQQMLAIARGLLTNPRILLLDEPTEGLAPRIVDDLVVAIGAIQAEGVAIILVEQKFKVPLAVASRQYLMDDGRIVWAGTTAELQADRGTVERLVGF